jgi:hypothetical protein
MTFHEGEAALSQWMATHARVVFIECSQPWVMEEDLIRRLNLPLNLAGNQHHSFHQELTTIRREHKTLARSLPVLV